MKNGCNFVGMDRFGWGPQPDCMGQSCRPRIIIEKHTDDLKSALYSLHSSHIHRRTYFLVDGTDLSIQHCTVVISTNNDSLEGGDGLNHVLWKAITTTTSQVSHFHVPTTNITQIDTCINEIAWP